MCGFFGILNLDGESSFNVARFKQALGLLKHRGPDVECWKQIGNEALLGHTRLSIIDLSEASNQPMVIDNRYWLVFNGEIFNYLELRSELKAAGVIFRSSGDAEVILQAYIHWGANCVQRFNGMWGFAIYDQQERVLFCSRDRYGEKPFNYLIYNGKFYFASEIKAILAYEPQLAEPNYNVISNFCRFSVGAQHPETWFKKILRLQPGHNLTIRNGQIFISRYWHYPQQITSKVSFAEACEEYRRIFVDAVRIRMRSDVPLGITLSSGIDSSSIVYAMRDCNPRPYHCFTSRFLPNDKLTRDPSVYVETKGMIDESVTSCRIAQELGLISHVVDTDYSEFVSQLYKIIWHLESGNSSPAVFPLMQLLRKAREHVIVVLDGQGADELLGGYLGNVIWQSCFDLIVTGKLKEALASIKEYKITYRIPYSVLMALRDMSNDFFWLSTLQQRLMGISSVFGPMLRDYVRMPDFPHLPDAKERTRFMRVLRHQHSGGLVNLLHYGDAISMANSIEMRMPFLDYRLVEYVWSLPNDFKIKHGVGKYIHREAMRGLVPTWILNNRIKFGFNTPISRQFQKKPKSCEDPIDVLLSSRCLNRGLFSKAGLQKVIEIHRKRKRDYGLLLYRLLSTELWFQRFVDMSCSNTC